MRFPERRILCHHEARDLRDLGEETSQQRGRPAELTAIGEGARCLAPPIRAHEHHPSNRVHDDVWFARGDLPADLLGRRGDLRGARSPRRQTKLPELEQEGLVARRLQAKLGNDEGPRAMHHVGQWDGEPVPTRAHRFAAEQADHLDSCRRRDHELDGVGHTPSRRPERAASRGERLNERLVDRDRQHGHARHHRLTGEQQRRADEESDRETREHTREPASPYRLRLGDQPFSMPYLRR